MAKFNVSKIQLDSLKRSVDKYSFFLFSLAFLLIVLILFIFYYVFLTYKVYSKLNEESSNLDKLSYLGVTEKNLKGKTVEDLINEFIKVQKVKKNIEKKFETYQTAYKNLLINFYLPSLNIWKDPYSEKIDISLVGEKFLQKNPYVDTNLISYWSNFLKDVGNSLPQNDIKSLKIGTIKEDKKTGIFIIPVSVNLVCPDRRSFLGLMNKIFLTASKKNIILINEFFYNLFKVIKQKHPSVTDKKIGEDIYNWVKNGKKEKFIDEKILNETIRRTAGCNEDDSDKICYFKFRDKYRLLPYIAYNLGNLNKSFKEKKNFIRLFLMQFPPLIDVKKFVFNKANINVVNKKLSKAYNVDIDFDVYGRAISNEEVEEIKKVLGSSCFGSGNNKKIDFDIALNIVKNKISLLANSKDLNAKELYDLHDIYNYLSQLKKTSKTNSTYQYVIKLFEIYRILKSNNLCNK